MFFIFLDIIKKSVFFLLFKIIKVTKAEPKLKCFSVLEFNKFLSIVQKPLFLCVKKPFFY